MNSWRRDMRELLDGAGTVRPAALRRSLSPDFLYATDLPGLLSREELRDFRKKAEERGWSTAEEKGRLQMKKRAEQPPEGWFEGPFGPEAACCGSLMKRHGGGEEYDEEGILSLIKAGEEGPEAYEQVCGRMHRQWAERLRKKEELPGTVPAWFGMK